MKRIHDLVGTIESSPDTEVKQASLELVQTIMDFHRTGLEQMMGIIADTGAVGFSIFDLLAKNELTASMLLLYDLHPVEIETRVRGAIESVRPTLGLHEGDVELISIENGAVLLRLKGSCNGCPSSSITLKHTIEEAILCSAPDVSRITVEGLAEPPRQNGLVQIEERRNGHRYARCEFTAA